MASIPSRRSRKGSQLFEYIFRLAKWVGFVDTHTVAMLALVAAIVAATSERMAEAEGIS